LLTGCAAPSDTHSRPSRRTAHLIARAAVTEGSGGPRRLLHAVDVGVILSFMCSRPSHGSQANRPSDTVAARAHTRAELLARLQRGVQAVARELGVDRKTVKRWRQVGAARVPVRAGAPAAGAGRRLGRHWGRALLRPKGAATACARSSRPRPKGHLLPFRSHITPKHLAKRHTQDNQELTGNCM
jgi:hypothetical protein